MTTATSERIVIEDGDTLSDADVEALLRRRECLIVALVGDREGGKTSLCCAFYEALCKGPLGNYTFIESKTILGFEKRLFLTRAVSGAVSPSTPHTSLDDGLGYLHIAVNKLGVGRVDLLLADRAGETYREARQDPAAAPELPELGRAQHSCFIIDGEKIANAERANAIERCRTSIDALVNHQRLSARTKLNVIATKSDIFGGIEAGAIAYREFRPRLSASLARGNLSAEFFETSLRGDVSTRRSALCRLLDHWTMPNQPIPPKAKEKQISVSYELLTHIERGAFEP